MPQGKDERGAGMMMRGGKNEVPHGLWMLVGLEIAALWFIRRSFRSSHGG